ncbi:MAG: anion permease [Planctomycetes bacterium]|nr:anion permease [Planctomycetota bacterium]
MIYGFLIAAVVWLCYSNGANDNFKGVATLYGSGTASYRKALIWATAATGTGCLVSVLFAERLIETFSGKGLIPDDMVGDAGVLLVVSLAAAVTIFLATMLGMPTSTTHALIGSLLGISVAASVNQSVNWGGFAAGLMLPLLLSPLLAIGMAVLFYPIFRRAPGALSVVKHRCMCIGKEVKKVFVQSDGTMVAASTVLSVSVDKTDRCEQEYLGPMVKIESQSAVTGLHYLSGAAVCFSRALNDTPKIAALLLAARGLSLNPTWVFTVMAVTMCAGGLLQSRGVAETMSKRITRLSVGEGLSANLITAFLVLFASHGGIPVSTTHVSCGSLFGIGMAKRSCQWKTILEILAVWVTTLPLAALLGGIFYMILF